MAWLLNLLPGLFKLGDKLIVDQDKKAEYAFNIQKMMFDLINAIVTMKTIPWVDALVKVLFALVAFGRPLGSFFLSLKGVDMAVANHGIDEVSGFLMGLFPAWGAAREANKRRQHKEKMAGLESTDNDYGW